MKTLNYSLKCIGLFSIIFLTMNCVYAVTCTWKSGWEILPENGITKRNFQSSSWNPTVTGTPITQETDCLKSASQLTNFEGANLKCSFNSLTDYTCQCEGLSGKGYPATQTTGTGWVNASKDFECTATSGTSSSSSYFRGE